MTQLQDAREARAAAVALQEAIVRMRSVIGDPLATARRCEIYAEELVGEMLRGPIPREQAKQVAKSIAKELTHAGRIRVVLGDRTMKINEIVRALIESGVPETRHLRHTVSDTISHNCGSEGSMSFTRVRFGWYKNRTQGDPEKRARLPKGFLVRRVYDLLGTGEELSIREISLRLEKSGTVDPDWCTPLQITPVLVSNCRGKGLDCFSRVRTGVYRKIKGQPPAIVTAASTVVDAVCTVLSRGSLAYPIIYARFCERYPKFKDTIHSTRLRNIITDNAGAKGKRVFVNLGRGVFDLANINATEQILRVMGHGRPMTVAQVTEAVADIGRALSREYVQLTLGKNSGPGMPLRRVRYGVYARNNTTSP